MAVPPILVLSVKHHRSNSERDRDDARRQASDNRNISLLRRLVNHLLTRARHRLGHVQVDGALVLCAADVAGDAPVGAHRRVLPVDAGRLLEHDALLLHARRPGALCARKVVRALKVLLRARAARREDHGGVGGRVAHGARADAAVLHLLAEQAAVVHALVGRRPGLEVGVGARAQAEVRHVKREKGRVVLVVGLGRFNDGLEASAERVAAQRDNVDLARGKGHVVPGGAAGERVAQLIGGADRRNAHDDDAFVEEAAEVRAGENLVKEGAAVTRQVHVALVNVRVVVAQLDVARANGQDEAGRGDLAVHASVVARELLVKTAEKHERVRALVDRARHALARLDGRPLRAAVPRDARAHKVARAAHSVGNVRGAKGDDLGELGVDGARENKDNVGEDARVLEAVAVRRPHGGVALDGAAAAVHKLAENNAALKDVHDEHGGRSNVGQRRLAEGVARVGGVQGVRVGAAVRDHKDIVAPDEHLFGLRKGKHARIVANVKHNKILGNLVLQVDAAARAVGELVARAVKRGNVVDRVVLAAAVGSKAPLK